MFTGIIEEVGKVLSITNNSVSIQAKTVVEDAKIGDSIAVNGVCLTIIKLNNLGFDADISSETYKVTALGKLISGEFVNLERAMPVNGRFGGHIVSGHIDGIGKVRSVKKQEAFYNIELELQPSEAKYVVKKGSIAVDGISLTVADINNNTITIAVIPHTVENTRLQYIKTGDIVNIETDILSKYVEKFLSTSDNNSVISMEFIQQNGF